MSLTHREIAIDDGTDDPLLDGRFSPPLEFATEPALDGILRRAYS